MTRKLPFKSSNSMLSKVIKQTSELISMNSEPGSNRQSMMMTATLEKEITEEPELSSIHPTAACSYTALGSQYERKAADLLSTLFNIHWSVIGGYGGDQGIDLRGLWTLPKGTHHYIVGQCKRTIHKIPSSWIRDFEGVLKYESKNTLGFFIATSMYTYESLARLRASNYPLVFIQIPLDSITTKEEKDPYSTENYLRSPIPDFQKLFIDTFFINAKLQELLPKLNIIQKTKKTIPSSLGHKFIALYDGKPLLSEG